MILSALPRKGLDVVDQSTLHPTITVDSDARSLVDTQPNFVGKPGLLGRSRLVYALPFSGGPVLLLQPLATVDATPRAVASPAAEIVGMDWVVVSRMATALPTEDTRSLGGGGAP